MNRLTQSLAASSLLLLAGGTVSADVFSSPTRTNNATVVVTETSPGSNRWNVTIKQDSAGTCVVLLDSTDSNDVINNITILDNTGLSLDQVILTIRKDQIAVARSSLLGVEAIDNLNPSGVYLDLRHIVIDGSIGSSSTMKTVEASTARTINIGGSLYANIIANNTTSGSTSTDNISAIIDGSVVGAGIYNNSGDISSLTIGSSVQPSGGDYPEFWSSGSVGSIEISGSFEGRIGSNSEGFSGHPDVGDVLVDGDFMGSSAMTMNSLDFLQVGGDFDADVTISAAMGMSGFYDIAGEMVSTAEISLPSDGLEGQIIVNSGDNSDTWDGDVVVGSTTLAPNYTTLSSELGGGQVGVAPFNFHQRTTAPGTGESKDCDPHQSEVVTAAYDSGTKKNEVIEDVRIRHYGPVYVNGSEEHFVVEFKADALPSSWVDRSSLFEVNTTDTATSALTAHRDVVIEKKTTNTTGFTAAGRWRIRPVSGHLKCGDVNGNPDVVWDSNYTADGYDWYTFRVLLEAPEQQGMTVLQGGTSSSDLTSWGVAPFEVNGDGDTDSNDFSDLVDSYTSN
ncbi:MAG: hypothetical protein R3B67_09870 [Phycisphaerales bacterium]